MRTNYVLIDFENLQPELLEALNLEHFRLFVFVGVNQPQASCVRRQRRKSRQLR